MEQPSRYQILFDIADGGMGKVSAARLRGDHGFRRTVAAKRIHSHLARSQTFYQQFTKEADLAARIRDSHVVQVHELVEQNGELLLVMELIHGASLRQVWEALTIQGKHFETAVAIEIACAAARGLHAAHTAVDDTGKLLGLIHRDVSPQNILLTFTGEVKVTDFGIAKALAEQEQTLGSTVHGKPAYMAPEQVLQGRADVRTDVWALGVVTWELLAGERLFRGKNEFESSRLVTEAPIPFLSDVRPEIPRAVAQTIARALARDPDARWPDAQVFARELESCVSTRASREEIASAVRTALPDAQTLFESRLRSAVVSASMTPTLPNRRDGYSPKRGALVFTVSFAAVLAAFAFRQSLVSSPANPPAESQREHDVEPDLAATKTSVSPPPAPPVVDSETPSRIEAPAAWDTPSNETEASNGAAPTPAPQKILRAHTRTADRPSIVRQDRQADSPSQPAPTPQAEERPPQGLPGAILQF